MNFEIVRVAVFIGLAAAVVAWLVIIPAVRAAMVKEGSTWTNSSRNPFVKPEVVKIVARRGAWLQYESVDGRYGETSQAIYFVRTYRKVVAP